MKIRSFTNDRDDRRLGFEQSPHARVVRRFHAPAASHAKRAETCSGEWFLNQALKELRILGIAQWVATLDEVETELIEPVGNEQFVLQRKADAFALGPVAKGRVVDLDRGHERGAEGGRREVEGGDDE